MRILAICLALLAIGSAGAAPGWAEDSDRLRYYLHLRGQDSNPWTEVHDHWGLSLGANLGRHWGLELSADTFERRVKQGGNTVGEFAVGAFVPQLRLRYPLLDDRLVPYLVAGAGIAFTDFNDRKPRVPPNPRVSVRDEEQTFPVGTVGAGIEYYFADNLAAGIEIKYLAAGDATLRLDGARHSQQVASVFTTVGLRLLVPELRPQPPLVAGEPVPQRLYFAFRSGTAVSTDTEAFSSVEIRPEPPAYFSQGNQFWGVALGMDLGRHLAVELAAEGYEVILATPAQGSVAEMALLHLLPQVRLRYPMLNDRLVPYAVGGVGAGYAERNDRKPGGAGLDIETSTWGIAATVGAGIEYFVASNIALGVEARYMTNRGHTIQVKPGPESSGHYDAVIVALNLRVVLAQFGR
jgi:opacity protein-like surface antigen